MRRVEDEKMINVSGGAISGWTVAGIGILVTFLAGVFDGIARPEKCR